jgi:hypothetical protein
MQGPLKVKFGGLSYVKCSNYRNTNFPQRSSCSITKIVILCIVLDQASHSVQANKYKTYTKLLVSVNLRVPIG